MIPGNPSRMFLKKMGRRVSAKKPKEEGKLFLSKKDVVEDASKVKSMGRKLDLPKILIQMKGEESLKRLRSEVVKDDSGKFFTRFDHFETLGPKRQGNCALSRQ